MASVKYLKDLVRGKKRKLPWRGYIHHPRVPDYTYSKCFATKEEYDIWADEEERRYRMRNTPEYFKLRAAEKLAEKKVENLIQEFIARGRCNDDRDVITLTAFQNKSSMSKKALGDQRLRTHAYSYRDERLKGTYRQEGWKDEKPRLAGTVKREFSLLSTVFQTAIDEEWEGYEGLLNPFKGIKIKGSFYQRNRTLLPGELEKLEDACDQFKGMNRYYLPLAIYLAIETAMRAQEIFNLLWSDVTLEKRRRIWIRKSKTDKEQLKRGLKPGRIIVLPYMCMLQLKALQDYLIDKGQYDPEGRIFPLTREGKDPSRALLEAFRIACDKAELKPDKYNESLEFRDTRRTANVLFEAANLTPVEVKLMRGRIDRDTEVIYRDNKADIYLRADPESC